MYFPSHMGRVQSLFFNSLQPRLFFPEPEMWLLMIHKANKLMWVIQG